MNDWTVKDVDTGDVWHKDSRKEAEEAVEDFGDLRDLEIIPPTQDVEPEVVDHSEDDELPPPEDEELPPPEEAKADGGAEVVDTPEEDPRPTQDELENDPDIITSVDDLEQGGYDLPDKPDVDKNPIEWMPSHFIDEIQGVPTVNRMGYCILCEQYGVSVKAEPVTLPSETDFEYAEFRAVATTEDGQEYTGFGSAHVDRQDGDDPYLLAELAETRSLKRAAAWATGIGMTAAVEMGGSE